MARKYIKEYTFLVIKEIHIIQRLHVKEKKKRNTHQNNITSCSLKWLPWKMKRISVDEDVEKLESFCIGDKDIKSEE